MTSGETRDTDDLGAGIDETSLHLRRARAGDGESLCWIVSRLSPLLEVQAGYRLPPGLTRLYEPGDLVNEVWAVALPRLADLGDPRRRCTPVLLKFLSTTLLHKVNHLIVKHIRDRSEAAARGPEPSASSRPGLEAWPAQVTSVLAAAQRNEARATLEHALTTLDARDREVIVLRGIEQIPNDQAAQLLGEAASTVAMRYGRALEKLRSRIPGSILDELPA